MSQLKFLSLTHPSACSGVRALCAAGNWRTNGRPGLAR